MDRVEGLVKWFNNEKSYGFIIYNDADYFVYFKSIVMNGHKTLREKQRVTFIPMKNEKGLIAVEVKPLAYDDSAGNK